MCEYANRSTVRVRINGSGVGRGGVLVVAVAAVSELSALIAPGIAGEA